MESLQLTTTQLQTSLFLLNASDLNLGATVVGMVDVTKFAGDTVKQIFRSVCGLMTLPNINNGANLRLYFDAQNTK